MLRDPHRVPLAVLPLLLASCIEVPDWRWMNTWAYPGVFYGPDSQSICPDDPFELQTRVRLQAYLRLWMNQHTPQFAAGPEHVGPWQTRGGWWTHPYVDAFPATLWIERSRSGQVRYRRTGSVTRGACWTGSWARCELLAISKAEGTPDQPYANETPWVDVVSGWFVPATGQGCWTIWRGQTLGCHPATRERWGDCWLPVAVVGYLPGEES